MRLTVPGIPHSILATYASPSSASNVQHAKNRLIDFIKTGNITLLTGAGVSVDSGIRAYRGRDGRYLNPNYKPIFYHELVDPTEKGRAFRRRYWLRSYLGYPPVRDAQPNTTHFPIAALQTAGYVSRIITQNVDGLHHKALSACRRPNYDLTKDILELHGTLHRVHCSRGHVVDRGLFQDWLSAANPKWHQYAQELERTKQMPRTNPDGDVAIEHLGLSFDDFVIPECPSCLLEDHRNAVQKPAVIFFGESIPEAIKLKSHQAIEAGDKLLLIGTTLATYSAFRLLKHALELQKPVLILNVGPTRADTMPIPIEKIEVPSGLVMQYVAREVIGSLADKDGIIHDMLKSGVCNPPLAHADDDPASDEDDGVDRCAMARG